MRKSHYLSQKRRPERREVKNLDQFILMIQVCCFICKVKLCLNCWAIMLVITDLIFVHFKVEFRFFFFSGFTVTIPFL